MRSVIVYGLRSSADRRIRYIGQTVATLRGRLGSHLRCARTYPRRRLSYWIAKVLRDGHQVEIVALDTAAVWNVTERAMIASFLFSGHDLVNATDGGEGNLGRVWSDAERAAMSERMKGKKKSPEHIAKMSAQRLGKKLLPEVGAKVSAALKGRVPKNLAALHAANRGSVRSPELRERISAALKGRQVTASAKLRAHLQIARTLRGGNSPETRKKIAAALTGRKLSEQTKAAIGRASLGRKKTDEERAKLSAANIGKKLSAETIAKRTATRRANGSYERKDENRVA